MFVGLTTWKAKDGLAHAGWCRGGVRARAARGGELNPDGGGRGALAGGPAQPFGPSDLFCSPHCRWAGPMHLAVLCLVSLLCRIPSCLTSSPVGRYTSLPCVLSACSFIFCDASQAAPWDVVSVSSAHLTSLWQLPLDLKPC